jgi:NAD(P)-dependent dehydrogenase (short-subunit alcohol dehydrogenase family)
MDKLQGKVAVVTGAASGMGEAIALLFAKEGATVIASDVNEAGINKVADQNKDKIIPFVANVANEDDVKKLIAKSGEQGHLDILVNNAGVMDDFKTVEHVDDDTWNRVLSINLNGPMYAAREAIKLMQKQENGGVIINNASVGGLFGSRGGVSYTVSKHGLIGLTKHIASIYGIDGKIRANAIAPGGVKTNIASTFKDIDKEGYQTLATCGKSPMGEPEDIANLALFLASDDSKFINGATIVADGGWTAK